MTIQKNIIVLVGLMGSGKSRIGTELAKQLRLAFVDADREIEKAAGLSIAEIFEKFGEPAFRAGEKKVMLRLLSGNAKILASGGGAFIQPDIRQAVKEKAISIWLKTELDTLVERTSRTARRPLLQGVDKKEKLRALMDVRDPIYAEADITVVTDGKTPQNTAKAIRQELQRFGWPGEGQGEGQSEE